MQHVKQKAEQSKDTREKIVQYEDKMCLRGEPIPFRAYIPKEEVIKYRKDQKGGGRLIYKAAMKDPLTITAEEDEEQIIMRSMRNTVDELKRGYRCFSVESPSHSVLTSPRRKSSSTGRTRRE